MLYGAVMDGHQIAILQRIRGLAVNTNGQGRRLTFFFDSLDRAGWLIEMSRLYVRYKINVPLSHEDWAEFLTCPDVRTYRLVVSQQQHPLRSLLINLARAALRFNDSPLSRLADSAEFYRWTKNLRAYVISAADRGGRPIAVSDFIANEKARLLEQMRVDAKIAMKKFASKIGVSPGTYVKRLRDGNIPDTWITDAEQLVRRTYEASEDAAPVTDDELLRAANQVNIAWNTWGDAIRTSTGEEPSMEEPETSDNSNGAEIEEDNSLKFEPSAEDEGDDELYIDIGGSDER